MPFNSASDLADRVLGELVQQDARTAAVFDRFGLDHRGQPRQTVEQAALASGVPVQDVVEALRQLDLLDVDLAEPGLGALIRHIVDRHHTYVRDITPVISGWLAALTERHGDRHPELADVRQVFHDLSDVLFQHLAKEEHIVFPFIDDLAAAESSGSRPPAGPFGTLLNPIRVMESDHHVIGSLVDRLRTLTHGYLPPDDASGTYRRCYEELARFEQDLQRHVHLENDVLFPGAIALEARI